MSTSRPLAVVVQLSAREPSDSILVTRARTGVRAAEEALYTRYVGRVLALCVRLLGDRDEAEDVLQETFLEAFAELSTLRDASRFLAFVRGIAVHKAEGRFRRRRTRHFVLARSVAAEGMTFLRPRGELDLEVRGQLTALDGLLATMRDRDRACWLLCNVEGFPVEELAELMHRPVAIVRRRLTRAERVVRGSPVPTPLAPYLDESRPANARELLRAGQARRALRGKRTPWARSRRTVVGGLLAIALLLLGVGHAARHEALPLSLRDQRGLPRTMLTEQGYHGFDLSDGSRVTLASGARVDVLENSQHQLVLALRQGRVRFDVQHDAERTWRIECGPLHIEVAGTQFVIERSGPAVRVKVERGTLLVRGDQVPGGMQRLTEGHTIVTEPTGGVSSGPFSARAGERAQSPAAQLAPSRLVR